MARYFALVDGNAGAYGVVFPDLPGCTAMGGTMEIAISNAADAMRDWMDVTLESGAAIPAPRPLEVLRLDSEVIEALADGASLASVPLVRANGRPVKANLSIDAGILSAIDSEAARRKLTRSAFVELMAKHALPEMAQ